MKHKKSKIVKKAAKAQGIKVKKLRLVKVNAADIKGLPSAAYCPKCGQHFIVHNDDGSCVK